MVAIDETNETGKLYLCLHLQDPYIYHLLPINIKDSHTHSEYSQMCPSYNPSIYVVKNHYWINFHLEAKPSTGDQTIKKRHSHMHTSLTFKLDLSKVLNQCWQMVKAYAGSAFPPRGAGSEKFIALRHRSVICLPLPISNPESSTSGLFSVLGSAFERKSSVEPWSRMWKPLNQGNREDLLSSASMSVPIFKLKKTLLNYCLDNIQTTLKSI